MIEVSWERPAEVVLPGDGPVTWMASADVPPALAGPALEGAAAQLNRGARYAEPSDDAMPCTTQATIVLDAAIVIERGSDRSLQSTWTTWDCAGPRVIDRLEGLSLTMPTTSTDELARAAGHVVGSRFRSDRGTTTRRLYSGPSLWLGTRRAMVADWEGAAIAWREARNTGSETSNARAAYNLAVASEMLGRPDAARVLASEAHSTLDTPRTRRYLDALDPGASDDDP